MKKEEKVKFVKKSFSLPEEIYLRVSKKAIKEGRSVSNLVARILLKGIK